jgi:RND family efflux transporter MFP subunit
MSSWRTIACPVVLLAAGLLPACRETNAYKPPPPPSVTVSRPLQQPIADTLDITGQAAASISVDLVARIPGYLRQVGFKDGTEVRQGELLFLIEPEPYQAQLDLAQATVAQHQAMLKSAEAEYERQRTLQSQAVSTQANLDRALANRDSEQAAVAEAKANVQTATINLGYTKVTAPFDGRIGRHLVDPGNYVGNGVATKLATLQKIEPIYVYFNVNERDVLRVRQIVRARGLSVASLGSIPVSAALQNEDDYPHTGHLDFVDTGIDTTTGTLQVRAVFDNKDRALIPGAFVRLRIPLSPPTPRLLVPESALGTDQTGPYLLVVGTDDTVAMRRVTSGPADNGLRVIAAGLQGTDRVIIDGLQNATPGQKVSPTEGRIRTSALPGAGPTP